MSRHHAPKAASVLRAANSSSNWPSLRPARVPTSKSVWIAWVNSPELRFATVKAPCQRSIYQLLPLRGLSDLDFFDCPDRHHNWGGSAAQNAAAPEVISPNYLSTEDLGRETGQNDSAPPSAT